MNAIVEGLLDSIRDIQRLYRQDKHQVARRIRAVDLDVVGLEKLLPPPGDFPYGRMLLYQDETMEVILMNWARNKQSLPHDHGLSEGWAKVLRGTASHVCYKTGSEPPHAVSHQEVDEGDVFYAPKYMVHHTGNPTEDVLVTLHFYFPPIENMEVFDPAAERAAIVSSDCGAWWPDTPRQIVKSRNFGQHYEGVPAAADGVS
ncbi:MAG TPA: cysteine dioxygenase family protein [Stellaceae bacterium]|nr:cysteine dioxygenase family protein [Stellaceae bacterium]